MAEDMDAWLDMQLGAAAKCGISGKGLEVDAASTCSTRASTGQSSDSGPPPLSEPGIVTRKPRWTRAKEREAARKQREKEQTAEDPKLRPAPMVAPHWQRHVRDPVRHVRAARGHRLRNAREGSMFSGLLSEDPCGHAIDIPADFHFAMDSKMASFNWIKINGLGGKDGPMHHFVDARDFLESETGKCAAHGMINCSPRVAKQVIDLVTAGFSCSPYSTARALRREGSLKHPDSDLFWTFIAIMKMLEPDNGLAENVFGFALPESNVESKSPLEKFVEDLREHLPQYTITIFVLEAQHFLCFSRVRVYVALQHERIGGAQAARRLKQVVQAPMYKFAHFDVPTHPSSPRRSPCLMSAPCQAIVSERLKHEACSPEDIMLLEDDPRLVKFLSTAGKRKYTASVRLL